MRPAIIILMAAGPLIASPPSGFAVTRIVPDQFSSIQSAMAASSVAGDSIKVRAGSYQEKVDFLGKDVVLKSFNGPEATIIDAAGQFSSAVLLVGCGSGARLEGFTIRHGTGTTIGPFFLAGGGVHVTHGRNSGPTVENNWIHQNSGAFGGGVYLSGPARLLRNRITANDASLEGGGIYSNSQDGSDPLLHLISENEIFSNVLGGPGHWGGGVSINGNQPTIFSDNVIACNEADIAGGCLFNPSPIQLIAERNSIVVNWGRQEIGGCFLPMPTQQPMLFRANVVAFNLGGGVKCRSSIPGGQIDIECNDLWGNNPDIIPSDCPAIIGVNGNVREDPLFGAIAGCPPADGDLCLLPESPLLPENSPPGCGLIGARGLCGPIGIAEETPAPEASKATISARPNPFALRTTIVIDATSEPMDHSVRVVDARGNVVMERSLGTLSAGRHRWIWDGRDDRGRALPNGVYFAQLTGRGREVHTKIMILR